jgi:hypothetical protein
VVCAVVCGTVALGTAGLLGARGALVIAGLLGTASVPVPVDTGRATLDAVGTGSFEHPASTAPPSTRIVTTRLELDICAPPSTLSLRH